MKDDERARTSNSTSSGLFDGANGTQRQKPSPPTIQQPGARAPLTKSFPSIQLDSPRALACAYTVIRDPLIGQLFDRNDESRRRGDGQKAGQNLNV
jgi:hypothetical protein